MSYRRKKEDALIKHVYEKFIRDNTDLLASIGIPPFITDDYNHFIYYLEHGCSRMDAPMVFVVPRSDVQRMERLKQFLVRYYQSGLPVFVSNSLHPEAHDLAEKYARHFAGRVFAVHLGEGKDNRD